MLTPPMIHPNDGPSLLQSVWVKFQKDLQGSRKGWSEHNLTQTQKMSSCWYNKKNVSVRVHARKLVSCKVSDALKTHSSR